MKPQRTPAYPSNAPDLLMNEGAFVRVTLKVDQIGSEIEIDGASLTVFNARNVVLFSIEFGPDREITNFDDAVDMAREQIALLGTAIGKEIEMGDEIEDFESPSGSRDFEIVITV
ncbi:hypothetical protein VH571_15650 [Frondihabitans sp. 4ASC-45]|uniref:hypothetical protein n=1 Tax=Frondihabitans sp. 4ASC-45 TaxID=3111636 RepID=UPI003C2A4A78